MKKIFIFIGILIIALSILKSNILKPNKLSENTKESLSELADLNANLADDDFIEDKYTLKKFIKNSDKPVSSSDKDISIAMPLLKDFKRKDLKAAAERDKVVVSNDIQEALSNETLTNSYKINFFLSRIDELNEAFVKYLYIYDENATELIKNLRNTQVSKGFIRNFEASLKRSREKMERLQNYTYAYHLSLKNVLMLADTINSKDLFIIEGDSLVIADDSYLNKFNEAIEKSNNALAMAEKNREAYIKGMRNSSKKMKDYVEKN